MPGLTDEGKAFVVSKVFKVLLPTLRGRRVVDTPRVIAIHLENCWLYWNRTMFCHKEIEAVTVRHNPGPRVV